MIDDIKRWKALAGKIGATHIISVVDTFNYDDYPVYVMSDDCLNLIKDEHRGTMSNDFTWRGFIRATHKSIAPSKKRGHDPLRRHSQVYLDSGNFSW